MDDTNMRKVAFVTGASSGIGKATAMAFAAEGYAFSRAEIHGQIGKGGDNLVPSLLHEVSVGDRVSRKCV